MSDDNVEWGKWKSVGWIEKEERESHRLEKEGKKEEIKLLKYRLKETAKEERKKLRQRSKKKKRKGVKAPKLSTKGMTGSRLMRY